MCKSCNVRIVNIINQLMINVHESTKLYLTLLNVNKLSVVNERDFILAVVTEECQHSCLNRCLAI